MRVPESPRPEDFAVLGLVLLHPRHGYELAGHFGPDGDLGQIYQVHLGQLYAQLKRLEQAGYLLGSTEEQGLKPPRRVFHVTEQGAAVFHDWLDQPVGRIREIRVDFLLKLFFSRQLPDHDTHALVERQIHACEDYLARLLDEWGEAPASSFRKLVLSSRVNAARATIAWLRHGGAGAAEDDPAVGAGRPRDREAASW